MQNLDDLVSQAESIATNLEDDEVPHIHRNIEQLRRRGENFYNRAAQNDVKAAKLLGNKVGYELSAGLSKTLESLNVISSYDGLSAINIEDIPSFLKNERETAILSSINLTRTNTLNMSYKLCEQAKTDWWNREKNNILNLLVNSDKLSSLVPLGSSKTSAINSADNTGFTKTILTKEEIQYARELGKYVDNLLCHTEIRKNKSLFDILMLSESSPLNNGKCTELSEISRLVGRYCACRAKYSHSSLEEMRDSESAMSKGMVEAALAHLEEEYASYAQQYVDGTSRTITANSEWRRVMVAFVEHHLLPQLNTGGNLEDETVNSVPVWPLIYACCRAGLPREAVLVAQEAASNLGEFHALLELWTDNNGALPAEQARKLATEYKRHVRSSGDFCKRLMYCLLAGCDNDDVHGTVLASVDDFMWLRLMQLRRSDALHGQLLHVTSRSAFSPRCVGNTAIDQQQLQSCSLAQLQKAIAEEYGESHFQAAQQPLTYCRILLLCQMFEPALAFLARFEQLRCHAVHLALLLWQSELLLVTANRPLDAPLLSTDSDLSGLSRLNLARLVALYTRKFETGHPADALDLFFLLKDFRCASTDNNMDHHYGSDDGDRQTTVDGFVACASSLAVESGQLELLFGTVVDGGSPQRQGLLARYGGAVSAAVLQAVSHRLRQSGQAEAACDALQLAGRFQEAAADLAELIVGCVSLPASHPSVGRLQAKADFVLSRTPHCHEVAMLACVLGVARFIFATADRDDVEAALAALDRTQLLPASSDAGSIRSATEAFRNLPELVRSLFPGLLVSAMRTLRDVAKLRQNSHESLADISRRAAALITFTGQLPYRMPSEVYASLTQLNLEIN